MKTLDLLLTTALATSVSGHAFFQELYVNGVSAGHNVGIRQPPNNNPIEDVTSSNMACNVSPTSPRDIIPVKAGDVLSTEWHHELSGANPSDGDDPIAASHKGPIIGYLAKVDSATQSNVAGLEWFKIYEEGYDGKSWAVDKMIANGGKFDIPLPTCIPDGDYLFRAELIALHSAYNYPGAQFYMECAQISVSGGSGSLPADTVSIPGVYSGSDPGVTVNIYNDFGTYIIPGPRVFTCGSGGSVPTTSSPSNAPSASATAAVSSTKSAAAITTGIAAPTENAAAPTDSTLKITTAEPETPIPTTAPEVPILDDEADDETCDADYYEEAVVKRSLPAAPVERHTPAGQRALYFVA